MEKQFYDVFNMNDKKMAKELSKLKMGKWRKMVTQLTAHNGNNPNLHVYSLEGEILQIVILAIKANK